MLHLGCGLDSRVQRLEPQGPGWPGTTSISSWSSTCAAGDPHTSRDDDACHICHRQLVVVEIPDDRPTLVIGEGLLMYIFPDDVAALIDAALSRPVPTQTLVFDTVAPSGHASEASRQTNFRTADTKFVSTTQDLSDAFARHQGIALSEERSVVSLARRATPGPLGAVIAAVDALPAGHRGMVIRTYLVKTLGQPIHRV